MRHSGASSRPQRRTHNATRQTTPRPNARHATQRKPTRDSIFSIWLSPTSQRCSPTAPTSQYLQRRGISGAGYLQHRGMSNVVVSRAPRCFQDRGISEISCAAPWDCGWAFTSGHALVAETASAANELQLGVAEAAAPAGGAAAIADLLAADGGERGGGGGGGEIPPAAPRPSEGHFRIDLYTGETSLGDLLGNGFREPLSV